MIRLLLTIADEAVAAVLLHLQKMPDSEDAIVSIDLAPGSDTPTPRRRTPVEDDDDEVDSNASRLNGVTYQLIYRGKRIEQHLRELDLTGHNATVAAFIAKNPNCTAREVKESLGIKPKAVESTIYQLRTRNVIESVPVQRMG